jgi:hypothetical protein
MLKGKENREPSHAATRPRPRSPRDGSPCPASLVALVPRRCRHWQVESPTGLGGTARFAGRSIRRVSGGGKKSRAKGHAPHETAADRRSAATGSSSRRQVADRPCGSELADTDERETSRADVQQVSPPLPPQIVAPQPAVPALLRVEFLRRRRVVARGRFKRLVLAAKDEKARGGGVKSHRVVEAERASQHRSD